MAGTEQGAANTNFELDAQATRSDVVVEHSLSTEVVSATAKLHGDEETEGSDPGSEDEDEEEDPFLKFQNVMSAIDLDKVKHWAVEFRLGQAPAGNCEHATLTCEIVQPPLHGSFNLVYVLEFSDKVNWVVRCPIQGTRMKEVDVDKMNTDYSTMRYIHKTFDVPTTEIFTWETTCDRVGVPFAFMSFVTGESVCHRWVDKEWITEEKKLRILSNLARIMAKLQKAKFDKIGTLRFKDDNTFSHIGPGHTMVEDDETYYTEGTVYVDFDGPYDTLEDYLANEDNYEDAPETARVAKGGLEVMRIALESVPSYLRQLNRFELDFWDYNYQNILIDDDCNITGIYDWDGVRAIAQGRGCTRYPSWITRDWDPARYNPPIDGDWEAIDEDSPEQLSRYRKHYADTFASLNLEDYDPRQTRLSHILEAISIGMGDRFARQYIMMVLLNHAYGAEDKWPWEYQIITRTLMDPTTPAAKAMREKILQQFKTMWHAEWEAPEPMETTKANKTTSTTSPTRLDAAVK